MGRESKLLNIAWELKNLWKNLTRKELSEYYDVSERTLYTYSKQLNLPKKIDKGMENPIMDPKVPATMPVDIWIHDKVERKYKKQSFKNWKHFVFWSKAQPYPVILDTMERDGHTYTVCKFSNNKIKEAEEYEKQLCKTLK